MEHLLLKYGQDNEYPQFSINYIDKSLIVYIKDFKSMTRYGIKYK